MFKQIRWYHKIWLWAVPTKYVTSYEVNFDMTVVYKQAFGMTFVLDVIKRSNRAD